MLLTLGNILLHDHRLVKQLDLEFIPGKKEEEEPKKTSEFDLVPTSIPLKIRLQYNNTVFFKRCMKLDNLTCNPKPHKYPLSPKNCRAYPLKEMEKKKRN